MARYDVRNQIDTAALRSVEALRKNDCKYMGRHFLSTIMVTIIFYEILKKLLPYAGVLEIHMFRSFFKF
jgi:hypothetical protein